MEKTVPMEIEKEEKADKEIKEITGLLVNLDLPVMMVGGGKTGATRWWRFVTNNHTTDEVRLLKEDDWKKDIMFLIAVVGMPGGSMSGLIVFKDRKFESRVKKLLPFRSTLSRCTFPMTDVAYMREAHNDEDVYSFGEDPFEI